MAALPPLITTLGAFLFICGSAGEGVLREEAVMPDRLGKFNFEELENSIYSVALSAAPIVDEEDTKKEETSVEDALMESKPTSKVSQFGCLLEI